MESINDDILEILKCVKRIEEKLKKNRAFLTGENKKKHKQKKDTPSD